MNKWKISTVISFSQMQNLKDVRGEMKKINISRIISSQAIKYRIYINHNLNQLQHSNLDSVKIVRK